jgi:hypothetical protein
MERMGLVGVGLGRSELPRSLSQTPLEKPDVRDYATMFCEAVTKGTLVKPTSSVGLGKAAWRLENRLPLQ